MMLKSNIICCTNVLNDIKNKLIIKKNPEKYYVAKINELVFFRYGN